MLTEQASASQSRRTATPDTLRRPRIVFVGPLPPPIHGMAAVNRRMVDLSRDCCDVAAIAVGTAVLERGFRYHASKTISALAAFPRLLVARLRGARVFYCSVDDGLGGLWAIQFLILARLLGMRLNLHHHSFRYLIERTRVMAVLVTVAGAEAHHIVLCDEMKEQLSRLYPRARRFLVVPNSVDPPAPTPRRNSDRGLTIGLLSNLTYEKGVGTFVELLEHALGDRLDIRGVLAGPASEPGIRDFIAARQRDLGERLEWLGPVEGEAKEAFYAGIDLFVFPTTYRTESFGLVLLEALVRGVPVIAPRRGCICLLDRLEAAEIVPLDEPFAARALAIIRRLSSDRASLCALAVSARRDGKAMNAAHCDGQRRLVHHLASQALG